MPAASAVDEVVVARFVPRSGCNVAGGKQRQAGFVLQQGHEPVVAARRRLPMPPPRHPEAIVQRIHADITRALDTPVMRERFSAQDATLINGSPAEFAKLIQEDDAKWSAVIKQAGIRPE